MKRFLMRTFLCLLVASSFNLSGQEQVSFLYDKLTYPGVNFPILKLYQAGEELRFLSVEDNGEIMISKIEGSSYSTMLQLNENQNDLPYEHRVNDHTFVQFYEDKIIMIDLMTLDVSYKEFASPDRKNRVFLQDKYLFFGDYSDSLLQTIKLEDESEFETPSKFLLELGTEYLYYVDVDDNLHRSLLLFNIETSVIDTVYQNSEIFKVRAHEGSLLIDDGVEVARYNPSSDVMMTIYSYSSSDNNGYVIYKDELIFSENLTNGSKITVMDYASLTSQEYFLAEALEKAIYQIFLKTNDGDYVFQNSHFKVFRTEGLANIVSLDLNQYSRYFPNASDASLFFETSNILYEYDPNDDSVELIDTINISATISYQELYKLEDQFYLQADYRVFTNDGTNDRMESLGLRSLNPFGLSDRMAFKQTPNQLFIHDYQELYHFQNGEFKLNDSLRIFNDVVEFDDKIYFKGNKDGVNSFYASDANGQIVSMADVGYSVAKTEDEQYLLLRDPSFNTEAPYLVLEKGQNDIQPLDFMPDEVFRFLDVSLASTIYLKHVENDTVSVWSANLAAQTINAHFECQLLFDAYVVNEKLVFEVLDFDDIVKLVFVDPMTNTVEVFTPSQNNDFHLGVFDFACDGNSLLFEIASLDCSFISIWSTDGTLANTKMQLEDAAPVERAFADFAIHEYDERLYFSVKLGDNIYDHYVYDCALMSLALENYPEDIVLGRRFESGNSLFGISVKDPINGHSLINITDGDKVEYAAALGKFRQQLEVVGLGSSYAQNISESMFYGNDDRELVVLSVDPFGQEFYYVYPDGTIELLFDLNPGILDGFFKNSVLSTPRDKVVKIHPFGGHLYFGGHHQERGHQIYRLPATDLVSTQDLTNQTALQIGVFPNPSQDYINVQLNDSQDFDWRIIDLNGKVLSTGRANSDLSQLDISDLSAGLYYFYVELKGRKLIKAFSKL